MAPQHPRRSRAILAIAATLSLVLFQPLACFSWGPIGHINLNKAAALHVPATMPAFLKAAADRIGYLGPEPDRWREQTELPLKQASEPDHFIDLERLDGLGDLPPGRFDYIRMLYAHRAKLTKDADNFLPERVGFQPYIVVEIHGRLKVAFHEYRRLRAARQPTAGVEHNIVLYAGWMGHYVGDASMPLHTTVNFDGWVEANPKGYTTERGIHSRFETDFVARNIVLNDFVKLVGPPVRLQDPFRDYMAYLWKSHDLVEKTYALDKAGGFDGAGSSEAREFTRQRLAAASQMLLNLWYSAWVESGEQPAPPKP